MKCPIGLLSIRDPSIEPPSTSHLSRYVKFTPVMEPQNLDAESDRAPKLSDSRRRP